MAAAIRRAPGTKRSPRATAAAKPAAVRKARAPVRGRTTPVVAGPSDAQLAQALGPAWPVFERLLAAHPDLEREWKVFSAKAGPSLRLKRRERAIVYLQPGGGCFRATVVLGAHAVEAALASGPSPRLRAAIEGARPYVEGRPIALEVRGEADLEDLERLIGFKG